MDTGCTSSIAREAWLRQYVREVTKKGEVKGTMKTNKVFKFGDNDVLKAKGKYMIPITEAGKSWIMEVDVVESDVPLLMSKDMMKKMKKTMGNTLRC